MLLHHCAILLVMGKTRITITLPESLYEDIRKLAFEQRISMSAYIQQALEIKLIADIEEVSKIEALCQLPLMTAPPEKCARPGMKEWISPENFTFPGTYLLCDKHYKEIR